MKRSLVALAVMAISAGAAAQSSVTLYGVVDAGVTIIDGDKTWSGVTSGGMRTSRLGFRGTEDFGGGLKASFRIEGGLNVDSGDGASGYTGAKAGDGFSFRRHATVGLQGNFGEIRLGRELTAAYNAVSRFDPQGQVGIGASKVWGTNGGLGTDYSANASTTDQRINNAVTYISPSFSGLKVAANYGFGEVAGKNSQGRYLGFGTTYDNGPIALGLSAERLTRDAQAGASAGDITTWSLGGSYNFGVAKVLAGYRHSEVKDFGGNLGISSDLDGFMVGVSAPVGPGLVRATYNRYENELTGRSTDLKADHFAIGYVYDLSKRTSLYGTYAYLKNKDKGSYWTLSGGGSAGLDDGKQQGLTVGLSHSF